jgi:hypothetical protein
MSHEPAEKSSVSQGCRNTENDFHDGKEHPTSNTQHRSQNLNWMFGVERSAFSVSDHQIET